MKTNKNTLVTLDTIFRQREYFINITNKAKETLDSIKDMKQLHDQAIYSAAAGTVYQILADPNNEERYGRLSMNYKEIKEELWELDARFEDDDIRQGINKLLRAEPPKIEMEILRHQTTRYMTFESILYKLKEDKK
jgi:hypothetical protein